MSNDIYSKLTIIIPTFYPGPILSKCIDSLPLNSDIIIVDNGEDKELQKMIIVKKNNIRYFKIGDLGLPKSFNYALKKAYNENILITQPDVTFEKDSIKNLIYASLKYKDAGLLAPIIYEDFCVEAVSATAMFLKKSIITKIGGWDENIYTYLEDLDLCLKLRRNKFQIIKINNSIVNHVGFGSHKNENIFKSEMSRNWHFMWSSLYFKKKYNSNSEYLNFLLKNTFKYFFKTFLNGILIRKKKTVLNFMRLRACINYIFIKKSNYRSRF